MPQTPLRVNSRISKFCQTIVPRQEPFYVPIRPEMDAILGECFPNVQAKIEKDGGAVVPGWNIVEFPGLLLEAEYHGIWQSPDGELMDVSPSPLNADSILFLPDPKRQYEGRQVCNRFLSVAGNPSVDEIIRLRQRIFEIHNQGARAAQSEIHLSPQEHRELVQLTGRLLMLVERLGF